MNWVGGARSRVRFQGDRRLQKEFFERKKLDRKCDNLQQPTLCHSKRKKKRVTVSQDLLALHTVSNASQKVGGSPRAAKVQHVDLDHRRLGLGVPGARPPRKLEQVKLPFSPDHHPSRLHLIESQTPSHDVSKGRSGKSSTTGGRSHTPDDDAFKTFVSQRRSAATCLTADRRQKAGFLSSSQPSPSTSLSDSVSSRHCTQQPRLSQQTLPNPTTSTAITQHHHRHNATVQLKHSRLAQDCSGGGIPVVDRDRYGDGTPTYNLPTQGDPWLRSSWSPEKFFPFHFRGDRKGERRESVLESSPHKRRRSEHQQSAGHGQKPWEQSLDRHNTWIRNDAKNPSQSQAKKNEYLSPMTPMLSQPAIGSSVPSRGCINTTRSGEDSPTDRYSWLRKRRTASPTFPPSQHDSGSSCMSLGVTDSQKIHGEKVHRTNEAYQGSLSGSYFHDHHRGNLSLGKRDLLHPEEFHASIERSRRVEEPSSLDTSNKRQYAHSAHTGEGIMKPKDSLSRLKDLWLPEDFQPDPDAEPFHHRAKDVAAPTPIVSLSRLAAGFHKPGVSKWESFMDAEDECPAPPSSTPRLHAPRTLSPTSWKGDWLPHHKPAPTSSWKGDWHPHHEPAPPSSAARLHVPRTSSPTSWKQDRRPHHQPASLHDGFPASKNLDTIRPPLTAKPWNRPHSDTAFEGVSEIKTEGLQRSTDRARESSSVQPFGAHDRSCGSATHDRSFETERTSHDRSLGSERVNHDRSFGLERNSHDRSFGPDRTSHDCIFEPEKTSNDHSFISERTSHDHSFGPERTSHGRNFGPASHDRSFEQEGTSHECSFGPERTSHDRSFGPEKTSHDRSFGPEKTSHDRSFGPEKTSHDRSFGPEKTSHDRSFGPERTSHDHEFGPERTSHDHEFGPERTSHDHEFGPERTSHDHEFGPERTSHDHEFGPERTSHDRSFGPERTNHDRDFGLGRTSCDRSFGPEKTREISLEVYQTASGGSGTRGTFETPRQDVTLSNCTQTSGEHFKKEIKEHVVSSAGLPCVGSGQSSAVTTRHHLPASPAPRLWPKKQNQAEEVLQEMDDLEAQGDSLREDIAPRPGPQGSDSSASAHPSARAPPLNSGPGVKTRINPDCAADDPDKTRQKMNDVEANTPGIANMDTVISHRRPQTRNATDTITGRNVNNSQESSDFDSFETGILTPLDDDFSQESPGVENERNIKRHADDAMLFEADRTIIQDITSTETESNRTRRIDDPISQERHGKDETEHDGSVHDVVQNLIHKVVMSQTMSFRPLLPNEAQAKTNMMMCKKPTRTIARQNKDGSAVAVSTSRIASPRRAVRTASKEELRVQSSQSDVSSSKNRPGDHGTYGLSPGRRLELQSVESFTTRDTPSNPQPSSAIAAEATSVSVCVQTTWSLVHVHVPDSWFSGERRVRDQAVQWGSPTALSKSPLKSSSISSLKSPSKSSSRSPSKSSLKSPSKSSSKSPCSHLLIETQLPTKMQLTMESQSPMETKSPMKTHLPMTTHAQPPQPDKARLAVPSLMSTCNSPVPQLPFAQGTTTTATSSSTGLNKTSTSAAMTRPLKEKDKMDTISPAYRNHTVATQLPFAQGTPKAHYSSVDLYKTSSPIISHSLKDMMDNNSHAYRKQKATHPQLLFSHGSTKAQSSSANLFKTSPTLSRSVEDTMDNDSHAYRKHVATPSQLPFSHGSTKAQSSSVVLFKTTRPTISHSVEDTIDTSSPAYRKHMATPSQLPFSQGTTQSKSSSVCLFKTSPTISHSVEDTMDTNYQTYGKHVTTPPQLPFSQGTEKAHSSSANLFKTSPTISLSVEDTMDTDFPAYRNHMATLPQLPFSQGTTQVQSSSVGLIMTTSLTISRSVEDAVAESDSSDYGKHTATPTQLSFAQGSTTAQFSSSSSLCTPSASPTVSRPVKDTVDAIPSANRKRMSTQSQMPTAHGSPKETSSSLGLNKTTSRSISRPVKVTAVDSSSSDYDKHTATTPQLLFSQETTTFSSYGMYRKTTTSPTISSPTTSHVPIRLVKNTMYAISPTYRKHRTTPAQSPLTLTKGTTEAKFSSSGLFKTMTSPCPVEDMIDTNSPTFRKHVATPPQLLFAQGTIKAQSSSVGLNKSKASPLTCRAVSETVGSSTSERDMHRSLTPSCHKQVATPPQLPITKGTAKDTSSSSLDLRKTTPSPLTSLPVINTLTVSLLCPKQAPTSKLLSQQGPDAVSNPSLLNAKPNLDISDTLSTRITSSQIIGSLKPSGSETALSGVAKTSQQDLESDMLKDRSPENKATSCRVVCRNEPEHPPTDNENDGSASEVTGGNISGSSHLTDIHKVPPFKNAATKTPEPEPPINTDERDTFQSPDYGTGNPGDVHRFHRANVHAVSSPKRDGFADQNKIKCSMGVSPVPVTNILLNREIQLGRVQSQNKTGDGISSNQYKLLGEDKTIVETSPDIRESAKTSPPCDTRLKTPARKGDDTKRDHHVTQRKPQHPEQNLYAVLETESMNESQTHKYNLDPQCFGSSHLREDDDNNEVHRQHQQLDQGLGAVLKTESITLKQESNYDRDPEAFGSINPREHDDIKCNLYGAELLLRQTDQDLGPVLKTECRSIQQESNSGTDSKTFGSPNTQDNDVKRELDVHTEHWQLQQSPQGMDAALKSENASDRLEDTLHQDSNTCDNGEQPREDISDRLEDTPHHDSNTCDIGAQPREDEGEEFFTCSSSGVESQVNVSPGADVKSGPIELSLED